MRGNSLDDRWLAGYMDGHLRYRIRTQDNPMRGELRCKFPAAVADLLVADYGGTRCRPRKRGAVKVRVSWMLLPGKTTDLLDRITPHSVLWKDALAAMQRAARVWDRTKGVRGAAVNLERENAYLEVFLHYPEDLQALIPHRVKLLLTERGYPVRWL